MDDELPPDELPGDPPDDPPDELPDELPEELPDELPDEPPDELPDELPDDCPLDDEQATPISGCKAQSGKAMATSATTGEERPSFSSKRVLGAQEGADREVEDDRWEERMA
jgi:hypothetical protein